MSHPDFIHLHCHSDYSTYDGFMKIPWMVSRACELDFKAIALTDHGKLGGFLQFHKECQNVYDKEKNDKGNKELREYKDRHGYTLKPIFGLEAYIVEDIEDKKKRFHQTIFAKNNEGYKKLLRLSTESHKHVYKVFSNTFPCLTFDMLSDLAEDMVITSGCTTSQFSKLCIEGEDEKAKELAKKYKDRWGEDYYIEIMLTGYKPQLEVVKRGVPIAKELGIKVVATNDVHFAKKEEAKFFDVKKSISRNGPLPSDESDSSNYYMKSYEEMNKIFNGKSSEALHNTMEIEEKCNVELDIGGAKLPVFNIPKTEEFEKYKKSLWKRNDEESYLKYLAENGLKEKGLLDKRIYRERLYSELETIRFTGFERYFLIVYDYTKWAREEGNLKIGTGRGSGGGSLVLYALGITGLDPLKYNLSMDRFLYAAADYHISKKDFFTE